jgi:hypothetical protein
MDAILGTHRSRTSGEGGKIGQPPLFRVRRRPAATHSRGRFKKMIPLIRGVRDTTEQARDAPASLPCLLIGEAEGGEPGSDAPVDPVSAVSGDAEDGSRCLGAELSEIGDRLFSGCDMARQEHLPVLVGGESRSCRTADVSAASRVVRESARASASAARALAKASRTPPPVLQQLRRHRRALTWHPLTRVRRLGRRRGTGTKTGLRLLQVATTANLFTLELARFFN